MISVHPDFIDLIKEPIYENKFLNFVPRSVLFKNINAKLPRKRGCVIEELEIKDDKHLKLCLTPSLERKQ